jgi:hypothetical protein
MKAIFLRTMLLGWGLLSPLASAQSGPATFPLAGDWDGVLVFQGSVHHAVLHMNTTPEGKMTALLDDNYQKIYGSPATGGSFDGSHLILRFFYWITWQAKIHKPAPPTVFDGDWVGVEDEGGGLKIHFIFHIHNTEDGLMALLDCPDEQFKGALASKVSYDQASRELSITVGTAIYAGKMTADGKALDTSMTEPGYHFLIHFDRLAPEKTKPN